MLRRRLFFIGKFVESLRSILRIGWGILAVGVSMLMGKVCFAFNVLKINTLPFILESCSVFTQSIEIKEAIKTSFPYTQELFSTKKSIFARISFPKNGKTSSLGMGFLPA